MRSEARDRIPDQPDLAVEEGDLRAGDIRDGLNERLFRLFDNLGELGGELTARVAFLPFPHMGAHFAGWQGDLMEAAVAVRHEFFEFGRVLRVVAVPDPVDEAFAFFEGSVLAGDRVGEDLDALGMVVGYILREGLVRGGRGFGLGNGAAPGDVAGVLPFHIWKEHLADRGAGAVGTDDEVCS